MMAWGGRCLVAVGWLECFGQHIGCRPPREQSLVHLIRFQLVSLVSKPGAGCLCSSATALSCLYEPMSASPGQTSFPVSIPD
ncbi:hypothetical protein QBC45DRAFT_403539 [Copromyces sp. CBS 386.78]|nr:hypothetical protein QBC45DRAFT_403539 [Copromyces sp. CBS 386.78]